MGRTDKEIYRVIDNVNSYYRINSESKGELLLNKYPNAAAAYSLRLLDGYYRNPLIRVRREDGVEVDVYPDYNNEVSLDSLVTNVADIDDTTTDPDIDKDYTFVLVLQSFGEFVGHAGYSSTLESPSTATVCVWYDQSGNQNDAKQDAASEQPKIYDSTNGVIEEGGKPALNFDGISQFISMSQSPMTDPAVDDYKSYAAVIGVDRTSSDTIILEVSYSTSNHISLSYDRNGSNAIQSRVSFDGPNDTSNVLSSDQSLVYVSSQASANSNNSYLDGLLFDGTSAARSSGDYNAFGKGFSIVNYYKGNVQEFIFYNSDQTSNRGGIEQDINNHYQIEGYTPPQPLLDEFDGAAAAYSLRLLSSTYTGPLVRIRRTIDNTEVDVYPDSDGEFSIYSTIQDGGTELTTGVTGGSTDKTTLHEFLYGQDTDCTVVRWYDQASGNHATQDIAIYQPKIYDSATGVIIEGINPAIDWDNDFMLMPASVGVDFSIAWVWRSDNTGINQLILNTQVDCYWNPNNVYRLYFGGTIYNFSVSEGAVQPTTYSVVWQNYSTSETWYMRSNGNEKSFAAGASYTPASGRIGSTTDGRIQEIIVWNSNQSSNRITIESNINQHYNIY